MCNSPKQPPLSNANNSVNDLDDVGKNGVRANKWQPFDTAEAYARGNLSIEILIREKGIEGRDSNYYLALAHKRRALGQKLKGLSKPRFWRDDGATCYGPHWDNQLVLVPVAQSLEQENRIGMVPEVGAWPFGVVQSFVWLQELKKPDRSRAVVPKTLERLFFEIGSLPEDAEREFLVRLGLKSAGAGNEQVQCRPGIVNDVAYDCAPSERDRFARLQNQVSSTIRIIMNPKFVRVTGYEATDLQFEVCEVFLCPFYLGSWSETRIGFDGTHASSSSRGFKIL